MSNGLDASERAYRIIDGIYRLLTSDINDPVNIGNPAEMTILQFASAILELIDSPSEIVFKELPVDDPKTRQPDITRARELLGWEPKVSLETGLAATIEYLRELRAASALENQ